MWITYYCQCPASCLASFLLTCHVNPDVDTVVHHVQMYIDTVVLCIDDYRLLLNFRQCEYKPLYVKLSSELPIGSGFGSSAAFSVSLTGALFKFYGLPIEDRETISDWAFQSERLFHGKPSGIDNTIATFGGCVFYQDGDKKFTDTAIPLMIADTMVKRDCSKLVANTVFRRNMVWPMNTRVHECVFGS